MEPQALIQIYGNNAFELISTEIQKLALNSNIPFDMKYVELGVSFMHIKADQILEGKKTKPTIALLVSESFGEAAIYKYNICDGIL